MLTFEEARSRLLALARPLAAERIPLFEGDGRVLAEDIHVPRDVPANDYGAMDGYAVSTGDFNGDGPWRFKVHGESRPGAPFERLIPETACRLFTGGRVPDGADAVVMQEDTTRDDAWVMLMKRPRVGLHIRRRGEDLREGSVALHAKTRLRPAHLSLAATAERAWLNVVRRPNVSIVTTGDELRPPGTQGPPGSIADSISVTLRAMATRSGAYVRVHPAARDDRDVIATAFDEALRGTDLLVTVGGASVGEHDFVRPALESAGVHLDFWKVAMKPGKPVFVGMRGEVVVLGLPGNPASAMVTFALFGIPFLRAIAGDENPLPRTVRARVSQRLEHDPGKLEFVRATLVRSGGELVAHPLTNQSSGAVTNMAFADALVCIPEGCARKDAGDDVDVLCFEDMAL